MRVKRKIDLVAILLLGLLFLVPQNLYSEETRCKYFKNYTYKEYDHAPQNWGIAQNKDGLIYVANNAGVLIYDGVSWRVMGIPNFATVRSLAIDETGTVYIGGVGEIGYLKADEKGSLQYISLMDHLNEWQRNFSDVWRTVVTKEGIYFSSSRFLLRWDPIQKLMKAWNPTEPNHRFIYSFSVKGQLLIHQEGVGLLHVVNDSLEVFLGDEMFADTKERIFMIVPYDTANDTTTLLIGTRLKGFFLYDYDKKTVTPFPTEVDDYLKENTASHGTRLSSGDFALATRRGGVVIMNSHGRLKNIYDKTSGLQGDCVYYVLEDNQGNLWLCLDNGISKIEYSSPFFIFDNLSGLSGIILSLVRHHNDLYVGTTQGLYVLRSDSKKIQSVPAMFSNCWSLLSIKNYVLAATEDGVFQVDSKNNMSKEIIKGESFALLSSKRYPGRIWCGTRSGLVGLIQKNSQWIEGQRFKSINQAIRFIAEEENGNLWLVTLTDDVLKVDFTMDNIVDSEPPLVNKYDISHGLPGGRVYVAVAAGHVMFATDKGIFRFDEKNKIFIPDMTLGAEFAGSPISKLVFRLVEDNYKNIWFHSASKNYQAVPGPEGSYKIYPNPFRRIPMTQVNTIYPDPDGTNIWFGSMESLIRYNKTLKKNYNQYFYAQVRKVIANENLIFDGYRNQPIMTSKVTVPTLKYKDRNLHFEFASPLFEVETGTQYKYFLEGYDDQWSDWTFNTQKDYTNLDSGLYTFRVRAKNVYGNLSSEDFFQFKILLPWYRTWWAFSIYTISAFLLIILIVKWRSWKLEKEKQTLEQIIKERTKEIRENKQQLEKLTFQLKEQSEKLKEMDKMKSRFFANISHEFRTPLTLIMGPLEQLISENQDSKQQKMMNLMLRNSQRLLGLINQLLELSKFESGKMKLQACRQNIIPFIKGIVASFESLATKNELDLTFHAEKEDVTLYFDPGKLEEVILNLLSNAVKFTPPRGKITVKVKIISTKEEDFPSGSVDISFEDTGPGIPRDQLTHIFARFYQSDITYEQQLKGSGIGLSIAKELVELHHGAIYVHSHEMKGTEFIIRLPLGDEHLEPEEIVKPTEKPYKHKTIKEIPSFIMEKELEVPAELRGDETEIMIKNDSDALKTGKNIILVVEDNADFRQYIREALEPLYLVAEAANGQEGIQKAQKIIPDLIVSDIMMPKVDGYELCRVLKHDIKTSHIPIILLTAKASEGSIIEGLETGADDYITKPLNTKLLITRIKNLIDLRTHMQQTLKREMMLQPVEISISQADKAFLRKLKEVIDMNISDPDFNVKQMCKELDMSQPTVYRKIYALSGESPVEFIRSHRLKRGAELLKNNYGTISEVAMQVGFFSPAYFSKCFKEMFNQSPSTYMASQGE